MSYAKAPGQPSKTGGSRDRQLLNKTGFQTTSSGEGPLVSFVRP